ncbi:MAG: histidine ammonia-lyase [Candidatus Neomarinimicrobiota bacterium]|nr:histidine ammonia-lyase [Candidatus Neomarinimicrobiota bacterium]
MKALSITNKTCSLDYFLPCLNGPVKVRIDSDTRKSINQSHKIFLELLSNGQKIYGVNTGFGDLSSISINENDQKQLQLNLLRSHATGVGKSFDLGITRIIMVLKLINWSKGVSGVRLKLVQLLKELLNHDILPVIPRQGSVGASGDLAPLAHMALPLIGEGLVNFQERIMPAMLAMKEVGLDPIILEPKEGLSLINGTQVSTAIAIKACLEAENILKVADLSGALSVEASLSSRSVFKSDIHKLKNHPGQRIVASNIWNLLNKSEIVSSHKNCDRMQDPYSFRCIPQVHGICRENYKCVKNIVENEANSVSDNPIIMPNGKVLNSGHFHAESIAQAMDNLAIAIAEIGSIAERRIHYFMKGISDNVPSFIASNPGLESGFMTAHVTAASLVSENKVLTHPASVDSISTSGGQEDFVSMAPWAARKCLRVIDNVRNILSIELLASTTINELFHTPLKMANAFIPVLKLMKKHVHYSKTDRPLHSDIKVISELIKSKQILNSIKNYDII